MSIVDAIVSLWEVRISVGDVTEQQAHDWAKKTWREINGEISIPNAELQSKTKALEEACAVLQGIVDGAVHPETAARRVMVDLVPIRKVLSDIRKALK